MPSFADLRQLLGGQIFGRPTLPSVDLSGKTIIVTGANTGLGFEAAKHFMRLNVSTLILACRNVKKGNAAREAILAETKAKDSSRIAVWEVDLTSHQSVVSFSQRVRSQLPRLDGFVANAGIETNEYETAEGLEISLTVNTVSTMAQAITILPKLKQTSVEYGIQTTLTIIGTSIHAFAPDHQLDVPDGQETFKTLSDPKAADMSGRYALSKLILHQVIAELAQWVSSSATTENHQVVVNIVNPGWCASDLRRSKPFAWYQKLMFLLIGWTTEQGSRTLVHGVTAGKETHGCYLSECQVKPQSWYMRSERGLEIQKRLWEESVARVRLICPEDVDRLS